MDVPPSIKSALEGLTNIDYIDVQPLGKHDGFVHYTVRRKGKDEGKIATFNITVNLEKEEVNVENISKQLIFTSHGGLKNAKDKMFVYSALNYFRGPMLTVSEKELLDNTDDKYNRQLKIFYHKSSDTFSIIENKNFGVFHSPKVSIHQKKQASVVATNFLYEYPAELSPSKKALVLMATLKLMNCHYLLHSHLMPSDIPHLMPPGAPKEPLSVLKVADELVMRPSCVIPSRNLTYSNLLDGKTLATLLVVEYDNELVDQNFMEIRVRDSFGVIQFSVMVRKNNLFLEVYDSGKKTFGTFDGRPRNYKLFGKEEMFLKSCAPYLPSHRPDSTVYLIFSIDGASVLANLYLMNEWQALKLCMNSELPMHWKAVIIAQCATFASFKFKIFSSNTRIFASEFLFRKTLA